MNERTRSPRRREDRHSPTRSTESFRYPTPRASLRHWPVARLRNAPTKTKERTCAKRLHRDWDRWNRASAPAPAPLPTYQRQFAGNRYPSQGEQRTLESRNYHYQPRDRLVQQHVQRGPVQSAQAPQPQQRSAAEATRSGERAPNQNRQAQRPVPPTTAQRATSPTSERRGAPPPMANRGPGAPEQRAAAPRSEQRAAAPRPEQRSAPAMARGPAQPPQGQAHASQGHGQQARGQAQAAEHGNGNARAGGRKDEHNG